MNEDAIYLGIDGGGSKCRATLRTAGGTILGRGMAGPANPFQSIGQAIESIESATAQVLAATGLEESDAGRITAGIGLAGVNLPSFYSAVCEWRHPFRHMFLTTDLEIACIGAHDGSDGAVIVAGTGSCGYSTVMGKTFLCGAHGFPLGDKGSGAWIGLEAIKAVLLAADDLGPATSLTERLCRKLDADCASIIERMAGAGSKRFAELATLVFDAAEEGDAVARRLIENGAAYLSGMARKLWTSNPPRMSLLGGLRDRILPWMDAGIAERLSPPLHQPDVGAVLYAQRKLREMEEQSTRSGRRQVL